MLAQPPAAMKAPTKGVSFQTASGMYPRAEAPLGVLVVAQYWALVSSSWVPPTAVISGMLAGKATDRPLAACGMAAKRSHAAPPVSPEAVSQVMPWATACWATVRKEAWLTASGDPKLRLRTGATLESTANCAAPKTSCP